MTLRHVGTLVLALSLGVCAPASASAGNGNGKDNGNGKNDAPAAPAAAVAPSAVAPGNSANAPGQVKKQEPAAQAQVEAPAAVQQPAAGSAEVGVKPSNDTAHDTHAPAASDKTKQYGNGKTAGQIAMQNGAAPTTSLHGPGNSQPHKASPCAGGHEVDVHALKGKRGGSCGSSTPSPSPHPTPVPDPGPGPKQILPPSSSSPAPSSPPKPSAAVIAGGVTPTPDRSHRASGEAQSGILGSSGAVAGATLPFTGLDLWSAVFIGVTLILIGLALCRRATTVPVCKSEQEARP